MVDPDVRMVADTPTVESVTVRVYVRGKNHWQDVGTLVVPEREGKWKRFRDAMIAATGVAPPAIPGVVWEECADVRVRR